MSHEDSPDAESLVYETVVPERVAELQRLWALQLPPEPSFDFREEEHRLASPRSLFYAECVCGAWLISADEDGEIHPSDLREALAQHLSDVTNEKDIT